MNEKALSASLEDYLETIYVLVNEQGVARGTARSSDIAERMGVHKSTVTTALHALGSRGLVNYTPYKPVSLTADGRRRGRELLRRHKALHGFLVHVLRIDEETAEETACRMEHVIPPAVMERFNDFAAYMEQCPRTGADWRRGSGYVCMNRPEHGTCDHCRAESRGVYPGVSGRGSATP